MKHRAQPNDPTVTAEKNVFNSLLELRRMIIQESISDVPGSRHRLEYIGQCREVEFINDSKAVNVDLTWYSLERLDGMAVWIVGGLQRGQDYSMLKEIVADKVRAIVCLGKEHGLVYKTFIGCADEVVGAESAEEAVRLACGLARAGDKVILSPACASHDLFESYEDRGDQYTEAVKRMITEEGGTFN